MKHLFLIPSVVLSLLAMACTPNAGRDRPVSTECAIYATDLTHFGAILRNADVSLPPFLLLAERGGDIIELPAQTEWTLVGASPDLAPDGDRLEDFTPIPATGLIDCAFPRASGWNAVAEHPQTRAWLFVGNGPGRLNGATNSHFEITLSPARLSDSGSQAILVMRWQEVETGPRNNFHGPGSGDAYARLTHDPDGTWRVTATTGWNSQDP